MVLQIIVNFAVFVAAFNPGHYSTFGRILLAVFKDFIVLLSIFLVFSGGTLLLRAVFSFGASFFVLFSTSLLFSPVPKY